MAETIIDIKPYRDGWSVFEGSTVQPFYATQENALGYAEFPRPIPARRDSNFGRQRKRHRGDSL